ncbi:hypothetical protein PHMEG_00037742 [Phytophthora megakarya]|uniref:Uncharacterized protein n=1 Tax=Phytophthora megakarya TaxID=4795 RepID=A0A225UJ98_9STRA|nr:hypothetical protein PHMEG_00037742 [Phytophthora megakarya]
MEDAVLEAALSFIDEYSSDEADTQAVDDSHKHAAQTVQYKAPTKTTDKLQRKKERNERRKLLRRTGVYSDPNRSRNERKKEIAFLREQLQKLQLDVQVLQSKAAEQSQQSVASDGGNEMTQLIPRVWQDMATHQRRRKEEAESENIRLKLAVEQQQKVAESFRNLIRKRATRLVTSQFVVFVVCGSANM